MSKQATPPPPGDKPAGGNPPPPPPRWRHWLLPIGIIIALFAWLWLPAVHQTPSTSLSYSQFLSDVSAGKVKTITLATPGGTSTGPADPLKTRDYLLNRTPAKLTAT